MSLYFELERNCCGDWIDFKVEFEEMKETYDPKSKINDIDSLKKCLVKVYSKWLADDKQDDDFSERFRVCDTEDEYIFIGDEMIENEYFIPNWRYFIIDFYFEVKITCSGKIITTDERMVEK